MGGPHARRDALRDDGQALVVEPFDIRYQTQQNGGIVFLANSMMYCGSNNCTQTQQAMPSSQLVPGQQQ